MQIDFSRVIRQFNGEPILEYADKPLTALTIARNALGADHPSEQNVTQDEKVRRFKLALKLGDGEITTDEAALIKRLVASAYAPLIVGQVAALIEGESSIPGKG